MNNEKSVKIRGEDIMAGNELMVYLYNVYQLEKQKYDMKYAFERVQTEINEAKNSIEKNANITYQKQKEVIPTEESTFSSIATGIFLGIIYGGVFGYIAAWIGFLIDIISKKAVGLGGMIDKALEIILSFIWPLMLLLMEVSFEEWRTMWNFKLFIIVFLLSI